MNYKELINQIENNLEIVNFSELGNGVSSEWIDKAQKRLDVKFPPSYIWWLKNYGGGEINGEEIFSIYELDFDTVVGGDIVYMNELNRKNKILSKDQLAIQENDQGELYYINLREIDNSNESPIYSDISKTKFADNFFDFIIKKIKGY